MWVPTPCNGVLPRSQCDGFFLYFIRSGAMSRGEPTSDSTPFFSDESEAEGPEETRGGNLSQRPEVEPPSGVSRKRALLTVLILCYVNLLNYMDRFTVAGRPEPIRGGGRMRTMFDHLAVKPCCSSRCSSRHRAGLWDQR